MSFAPIAAHTWDAKFLKKKRNNIKQNTLLKNARGINFLAFFYIFIEYTDKTVLNF